MGKNSILLLLLLAFSLPAVAQKPTIKALTTIGKAPAIVLPQLPKVTILRTTRFTPLSGRVLFSQLTPTWKAQFITKFTTEHLRTVEDALHRTDARLFVEEDGLITARSTEWNYTERFEQELTNLLQERGQVLSPSQWKQLFGGSGVKGFTLSNHLRLLTLDAWSLTHGGEFPRRQFSVNGKLLKQGELSPEQKLEQNLANGIKWAVTHPKDLTDPIFVNLKIRYEQGSRKKTPEYWLEELKMWLDEHQEYPRSSFSIDGVKISPAQYTPEQQAEAALANGVLNAVKLAKDPSDPVIAELIALKQELRRNQTPRQTLVQLQAWMAAHDGRIPRGNIMRGGKTLTTAEMTPEELEEKRLAARARALTQKGADRNDPDILQIKMIFEAASVRKTSAQILEELQVWLAEHDGVVPRMSAPKNAELTEELRREVTLGRAIRNLLYAGTSRPTAQAAEVRRLWQNGLRRIQRRSPEEWLEAFSAYLEAHKHYPSPNTPEYAGIRNLLYRSEKKPNGEYVNPVVQQISEFNQLAKAASRGDISWKEVTLEKETPLAKFWRQATPRQQAALQLTAFEMEDLRDDFAHWLRQADEENWIVWDPQTADVLANLQKGLHSWGDSRAEEADNILVWLSDTHWGWDEEMGLFSRLRYTGDNIHSPKLTDFYEVQEFVGLPETEEEISIPKVKAEYASFPGGETRLHSLTLQRGGTIQALQQALEAALPKNKAFSLRMGTHELGISTGYLNSNFFRGKLHIHAEVQLPQEPVILSYTLDIDAGALVRGKSEQDIKRLYAQIFRPYLSAHTLKVLSR